VYELNMATITVHAPFNKAILQEIAINKLHGGTYQPRDSFALEGLESLAKTIAQVGVLEPLVVRVSPRDANKYEVVAGERRLRAAKLAGLEEVPCLLANYSNEQAAQIALIENTCREALNPIVEALAMHRLTVEFGYTHEEIAFLLGMSRATVTNLLRLLNLDARIQHWMKQGILSEAHGKILAGLPLEKQYWFAYEAVKKEWPSRVLDSAIKTTTKKITKSKNVPSAASSQIEQRLTQQLGWPIKLSINTNESGSLRILFHNRQQMQEILEKLGYVAK